MEEAAETELNGDTPLRVLAIYRHYWPDATPYARILRSILEHLASEGREVSVFTAQPSYNDIRQKRQPARETLDGVKVRRLSLLPERKAFLIGRAINFGYFLIRAMLHVIWHRKFDVIIANSHPPVLMGFTLRVLKLLTGANYIMHLQDIHPESSLISGKMKPGIVTRLFERMDRSACKHAHKLVTLSGDMANTLKRRGDGCGENVEIVKNFELDSFDGEADGLLDAFADTSDSRRFRVLFSGNLGSFQQLHLLVDAAHKLNHPEIEFHFLGEGAEKKSLIRQAGDLVGDTIHFHPYVTAPQAAAIAKRCDLGVVSLMPDVYRVAYPTKCIGYLSQGTPMLVMIERESQLAYEVQSQGLGYVAGNSSVEDVCAAIQLAFEERDIWQTGQRRRLQEFCASHFGRERSLQAWSNLIGELENKPAATQTRRAA